MAHWIQIALAMQLDIAANVDCLFPANFIWQMIICVLPDITNENSFLKMKMAGHLMELLPNLYTHRDFKIIKDYLCNDRDKRKSFQFATRIVALLEQHLIYPS